MLQFDPALAPPGPLQIPIDSREIRPALCDWIEWVQPLLPDLLGPTRFFTRS